jgi:pentatricopeptide repeat protein
MSTEANVQPASTQKSSPSVIQTEEMSEPSIPRPRRSGKSVDPLRVIEKLDLERLAGERDITKYLGQVYPTLSSPPNVQKLQTSLQIRLCLALLLCVSQLSFFRDHPLFEFTDPSSHPPSNAGPPITASSALAQARAVWNTVDCTKIDSEHDIARYNIAHSQLLAFEGRLSESEKEIEPYSNLKDELGVDPSWLVLQTHRLIFSLSMLRGRSLKDALRACLQKSELSSSLLGNHGISTLYLTRKYGSLLQAQIFDAFDQLPDLHSWFTSMSPNPANTPQRTMNSTFNQEEHRNLGVVLLHYLVNRLHAIRPGNSASRANSIFIMALMGMLDTFDHFEYLVPYQLKVQCSLELNRFGYAEEATRHLNNISSSSSEGTAYKLSALLEVAARQGDILRALDSVETLRSTGSLQKRDIRQLVLAYTRAPVYELGPVGTISIDNDVETLGNDFNHENAIPDRIADAEEVFIKLLAPHGPSIADYAIILDAYARRGDVEKVNSWIARMLDAGFLPDDIPWEKALRAFAVAGNVQGVVRVLDHIQEVQLRRQKHSANGDGATTADKQHRWSNVINTSVFNILLELMARRRDPLGANRLWRNVVFAGLVKPNFNSAVKLLRAHAEAGHWNGVIKAWKYLETMEMKEEVASSGPIGKFLAPPPHHTTAAYNTVLRAYIAIGTPFTVVMGLIERMKSVGVIPDSFTYTMAIISATDSGDMETAVSLFQQMEEQEATRGLPSASQQGTRVPVSDESLRGLSTIDYRPIYALTYLFHGYLRQKKWPKAREVYHLIERRGLKLLPLTYAVIIKSYTIPGARGNGDEGLKVAENFLSSLKSGWGDFQPSERGAPHPPPIKKERPSHDVAAYSPLMVDFVRQRKPEEVERLFEQMVQIGGDMSITALAMLMDVYRRVGDVDRVRETWRTVLQVAMDILEEDDLTRQISSLGEDGDGECESPVEDRYLDLQRMDRHKYPRSSRALLCYPFSIFMDAVSAVGLHSEVAAEWKRLKDAGFSFDAHNWNHLVTVLVRAGEVERAFEVVEGVIVPYALSSKQLASGVRLPWETSKAREDEDDAEDAERPLVEETVKWGRRRVSMALESNPARRAALEMLAEQQQEADSSEPDFVHELKLMQGVSRNWYQWKPHKSVLKSLSKVLLHLESGRLVLPLLPPGMKRDDAEVNLRSSDQAHVLLGRLQTLYPRTCKLAYDQVPAR